MLKNKRILVFGGDAFLWDQMFVVLQKNGAEILWINNASVINVSNYQGRSIDFDSINEVSSYEEFFNKVFQIENSFDGVVFSLSEGNLRPLSMTKPKAVSNLFEINCMAFIELIRLMQKKSKLNTGASIVAFSSISSLLGLKTKLAYAVSKASLNSAILNLATELSSKKIRVNGILKGALTTDINHEHVKNMFSIGSDNAGQQELGMTTPDELANLTIFLLSDMVITMTGTLIKLEGGYSLN